MVPLMEYYLSISTNNSKHMSTKQENTNVMLFVLLSCQISICHGLITAKQFKKPYYLHVVILE